MKRILLSLVAACFTLAAGSSFAQAPAQHPHHVVHKHAKKHHVRHVKHVKHKMMKRHVASKRAVKSAA